MLPLLQLREELRGTCVLAQGCDALHPAAGVVGCGVGQVVLEPLVTGVVVRRHAEALVGFSEYTPMYWGNPPLVWYTIGIKKQVVYRGRVYTEC